MPQIKATLLISALAAQIALFGTRPVSAMPLSPAAGGAEFIHLQGRPAIEVRNHGAGVALKHRRSGSLCRPHGTLL
jgi:hypothetical protein